MKKIPRIAIFGGGGFWHFNHLALAEQAWEQFQLDWVYLTPVGEHVDKQVGNNTTRRKYTTIACADNEHFKPCFVEMNRKGASYMCDTLAALKKRHPRAEFFLIIGQDRAPDLHRWHDFQYIIHHCTVLLAPRNGQASVTEEWARNALPAGTKFGLIECDWSVTFIRKQLAAGKSVRYLASDAAIELAKTHGVYQPLSKRPAKKGV